MVILVLGMLLAIALPAINTARRNAKRKQARYDEDRLMTAIKNYRNTYGKWPEQTQAKEDRTYWPEHPRGHEQTNLIGTLVLANPRRIQFLELGEESVVSNAMVDPWGRPYVVAIDEDGNGETLVDINDLKWEDERLTFRDGRSVFTETVKTQTVAVVSWGPVPTNTKLRVYSWTED